MSTPRLKIALSTFLLSILSVIVSPRLYSSPDYQHYKYLRDELRDIYGSFRREEKLFEASEFANKLRQLKEYRAKLNFPQWEEGYAQEKHIHPYLRKDFNYSLLAHQLFAADEDIFCKFALLANKLIAYPEEAKVFFATNDRDLRERSAQMRDLEEAMMDAHALYFELNKLILYENRKFKPAI